MKKTVLAIAIVAFSASGVFAQRQEKKMPITAKIVKKTDSKQQQEKQSETKASLKFETEYHDFGTIQEGDPAVAEFTFTNTGKEPIIIQNVHPSCGCTTPYWSKAPIAPGKTGVIKASYGTKGRVGYFNKSVTVTSNAGRQVLHIKGTVKRAPTGSVPQNKSMMKK